MGALNREAAFAGRDLDAAQALNLAGDCEEPVYRHLKGLPDPTMARLGLESRLPALQRVLLRCRACEACRQYRKRIWSARAVDEVMMSDRTWFGTLTMRPAVHQRCLALARRRCKVRRSEDFDALEPAERYKQVIAIANREITLFLKRVRKNSKAKVRYLLVNEQHKSGLPHWHILLHEVDGVRVPKNLLEAQWLAGYSHWRLVDHADPKQAFYACKYLAKDLLNRVRASFGYGRARDGAILDRVQHLVDAGPDTEVDEKEGCEERE